jgi:hypothetical protein
MTDVQAALARVVIDAAERLWIGRYEPRSGKQRSAEWRALADALTAMGRGQRCPQCGGPVSTLKHRGRGTNAD